MAARIAVINHDPGFLRLVARILKLDGHEALLCPQGTSPFDMIVREQPDLIMLDTWLSNREEGWTLLQMLILAEEVSHIPVVLSTSDITEYEKRASGMEQIGTISLLPKPFTPEALTATVRDILERERAKSQPPRIDLTVTRPISSTARSP